MLVKQHALNDVEHSKRLEAQNFFSSVHVQLRPNLVAGMQLPNSLLYIIKSMHQLVYLTTYGEDVVILELYTNKVTIYSLYFHYDSPIGLWTRKHGQI